MNLHGLLKQNHVPRISTIALLGMGKKTLEREISADMVSRFCNKCDLIMKLKT